MKKVIFVILGALVIVAVLGGVLLFVLKGGKNQSAETISLEGTWLIIQHGEELPRDEFMVFSGDKVAYYRNNEADPVASSAYTIKGNNLETPDIDKAFNIRAISSNDVVLTETNTVVWHLLFIGDSNADRSKIVPDKVEGTYEIKFVGEERRVNETITFTDTHMSMIQNGEETISSDYIISEDGFLKLTTINRDFYVFKNGNILLFVNPDDNCVWELEAIK